MIDANGNEYPDPPSDPVAREQWKKIYFAQNYGVSRKRLSEMMDEASVPRRRDGRFRFYIWLLRLELLATIVTLVLFLRHPNMKMFAYFALTLVPGFVTVLNPPRRRP